MSKNIGLYVHIPFCKSKCKYCDFNSFANVDDLQKDYVKALIEEINSYKKQLKNYIVDTIFIGGGTPSNMFNGAIATVVSELRKCFNVARYAEITIECNPNTITKTKAMEWKECGINRVSVGLQSSSNSILKKIGRTHTLKDYFNAMQILKDVKFDNINSDIMLGLPSQKQSNVKRTLNYAIKLGSTHISAYTLILEENTPLFNLVKSGKLKLPKEEKVLSMFDYVCKFLNDRNYIRYEVSNFCLRGYKCHHNYNTWSGVDYVGFGAGAHSLFDGSRFSNECDIKRYIEIKDKIIESNVLTKMDMFDEYIMLGLRRAIGIELEYIKQNFGIDLMEKEKKSIERFLYNGFIEIEDGFLKCTYKGFNILNQIIIELVK